MLARSILDLAPRPLNPLMPFTVMQPVMAPQPVPKQKKGSGPLGNGLSLGGSLFAPAQPAKTGPLGEINNINRNLDVGTIQKIFSMFGGM